jgi:hypothetical protein
VAIAGDHYTRVLFWPFAECNPCLIRQEQEFRLKKLIAYLLLKPSAILAVCFQIQREEFYGSNLIISP